METVLNCSLLITFIILCNPAEDYTVHKANLIKFCHVCIKYPCFFVCFFFKFVVCSFFFFFFFLKIRVSVLLSLFICSNVVSEAAYIP